MPRKKDRKKEKIRNYLNSKRLTKVLREAMIDKLSFEEMIDWYLPTGYQEPGWLWDKNDQELNEIFWNKFGDQLMKWWREQKKAGKRPWLFYKCYSKKPKISDYLILREFEPELFEEHTPYLEEDDTKYPIYETQENFLRRLGLLEDWEIAEIERQTREGTYKKKKYEKSNYFE